MCSELTEVGDGPLLAPCFDESGEEAKCLSIDRYFFVAPPRMEQILLGLGDILFFDHLGVVAQDVRDDVISRPIALVIHKLSRNTVCLR